jgi:hypothetical protein
VNRALRGHIEAIEKRVKPPEPFFVACSFDETDEELDARKRSSSQRRLSLLHTRASPMPRSCVITC